VPERSSRRTQTSKGFRIQGRERGTFIIVVDQTKGGFNWAGGGECDFWTESGAKNKTTKRGSAGLGLKKRSGNKEGAPVALCSGRRKTDHSEERETEGGAGSEYVECKGSDQ